MTKKTQASTEVSEIGQQEPPKLRAIHYAESLRLVLKHMKKDGIDCGLENGDGCIKLVIGGVAIDDGDIVEVTGCTECGTSFVPSLHPPESMCKTCHARHIDGQPCPPRKF